MAIPLAGTQELDCGLSACNFNRVPSIYGSSVGPDLHPVEFPARLHHGRYMSHV